MRKFITIVAAMMLVLAVGTVIADEMPTMTENKDVGTLLNIEAPGYSHPKRFVGDLLYRPEDVIAPTAKRDFSGPAVSDADTIVDVGIALYNDAFPAEQTMFTKKSIEGAAAGGVVLEDENTRIWDKLLAPTGESLE